MKNKLYLNFNFLRFSKYKWKKVLSLCKMTISKIYKLSDHKTTFIYCVKLNTVSTHVFNIYLFSFPLLTYCGCIMLLVAQSFIYLNWFRWELPVVCWWMSSVSYSFLDKIKQGSSDIIFNFFKAVRPGWSRTSTKLQNYKLQKMSNIFFLEKGLSGNKVFHIFRRYSQSLFFIYFWHIWLIHIFLWTDCLKDFL
jgi:hypothetical protein